MNNKLNLFEYLPCFYKILVIKKNLKKNHFLFRKLPKLEHYFMTKKPENFRSMYEMLSICKSLQTFCSTIVYLFK